MTLREFQQIQSRVGDRFSCTQQSTQGKKDNRWCLLRYLIGGDGEEGATTTYYVGELQYLVRARLQPRDGVACVSCVVTPNPLYLGVADLYECTLPATPGARSPDPVSGRPPEIFCVADATKGLGHTTVGS